MMRRYSSNRCRLLLRFEALIHDPRSAFLIASILNERSCHPKKIPPTFRNGLTEHQGRRILDAAMELFDSAADTGLARP